MQVLLVFLVAVSLWLVRASHVKSEVLGLWLSQLGEVHTQCVKVQASNHFVKVLGENMNTESVLITLGKQLDLSQYLVGE
jgi:hypothetical protein